MTDLERTDSPDTQKPARHRRSAKYAALDAQRQAAADEAAREAAAPAPEAEAPRPEPRPVSGNAQHAAARFGEAQRLSATQPTPAVTYTFGSTQPGYTAPGTPSGGYPPIQGQPAQPGYVSPETFSGGYAPVQQGFTPAPSPLQGYPPMAETPVSQRTGWSSGYSTMRTGEGPRLNAEPAPARERAAAQPGGNAGAEKPRPDRRALRSAVLALSLVTLAVAGFFGYRAFRAWQRQQEIERAVLARNTVFCDNVFVDGIDLSGMTQDEARAAVTAKSQQALGSWSVNLTHEGKTLHTVASSDLGVHVQIDSALEGAWNQGHSGDIQTRYEAMQALAENPYQGYSTVPDESTAQIDGILALLAQQFYVEPADAEMIGFNPDATYPFSFREEVVGQMLETAAVKTELYHRLSSLEGGDLELTLTPIEPEITVQLLKDRYYSLRGQGSTPISASSVENRTENIRHAFEIISGTIIQPGKTFSFNGIVGQRTEKNGFLPAPEYVYNEVVEGIGGGVCQASTTVYLAAVRANMRVTSREPHSMAVNYTAYGKDATVYWFSNHKIDLAFVNTTENPIYIKAAVQSDPKNKKKLVCNVYIYGEGLGDGVSYDIVTEETVIPAPTEAEYIRDKKGEYVTYTDQEYEIRKASSGMSVDSYRVRYEGGKEVSREFLYTDIYKEKARQVYVGIQERPKD